MTSERTVNWLKAFSTWVAAIATFILSAILSPLGLDNLTASYAFLAVAAIFAMVALFAQRISVLSKVMGSLLVVAITLGLGYFLWWLSQPRFEITAFNTLEDDKNAYEVTDQLIWNQNNLDKYGVSITFTIEVLPNYFGKQRFGKVIAQISGDSGNTLEKILWDDFTSESNSTPIQLTLPELIAISGIQKNSDPPSNSFQSGDSTFQQAKLIIQIVRQAEEEHPWYTKEITVRNGPWEQRSELVWRNDRREVDVYVKNLGGPGEFTVGYRLVRLEEDTDSSTDHHPMNCGTEDVRRWNSPEELVHLKKGGVFTDTVSLPSDLKGGRYLLEVYAVKKQDYVQLTNPNATWKDLNSVGTPWWFGRYPFDWLIFVETGFEVGATMQAELDRLQKEQGVDLGFSIESVDEVTSARETKGQHQVFQKGEVYVHNGQAYALYGPILEHYNKLRGIEKGMLGFPISSIEVVTSSTGITGTMMEFEGPKDGPAAIYASEKGVAATWSRIGKVYSQDHGGHSGWLGFPLADEQLVDEQHYPNSTSQMFEGGYVVYNPYVQEELDEERPPVVYPYLASRGTLFEVQAHQGWQNTGIQLQAGNHITIIQVDGSWSYVGGSFFDANGDPNAEIGEEHREILILPSSYVATLVGRIDENNDRIFPVGRWNEFTTNTEGTLYLAMNDIDHKDNSGAITVQIMVEPVATE